MLTLEATDVLRKEVLVSLGSQSQKPRKCQGQRGHRQSSCCLPQYMHQVFFCVRCVKLSHPGSTIFHPVSRSKLACYFVNAGLEVSEEGPGEELHKPKDLSPDHVKSWAQCCTAIPALGRSVGVDGTWLSGLTGQSSQVVSSGFGERPCLQNTAEKQLKNSPTFYSTPVHACTLTQVYTNMHAHM